MTTPYERMRAVGWGGELLAQMCSDASLPQSVVSAAKRIALTYPTTQALEECLRVGAVGLTVRLATSLGEARTLFREVWIGELGSAQTREDLRYVLRHFPTEGTIRIISETAPPWLWLWFER